MVIDQSSQVIVTKEMQNKLTWLDQDFKKHAHVQTTTEH
jgi:thiamine biosynthesis lipoprotein